jgi:hypothetical protein
MLCTTMRDCAQLTHATITLRGHAQLPQDDRSSASLSGRVEDRTSVVLFVNADQHPFKRGLVLAEAAHHETDQAAVPPRR